MSRFLVILVVEAGRLGIWRFLVWKVVHLLVIFDFLLIVIIIYHLLECKELEVVLLLRRGSVRCYLVRDLIGLGLLPFLLHVCLGDLLGVLN